LSLTSTVMAGSSPAMTIEALDWPLWAQVFGPIQSNYPRLNAIFVVRSRGSAAGAGSQPNTL
jgi:hypothetical protein